MPSLKLIRKIHALADQGVTPLEIATTLHLPAVTVQDALKTPAYPKLREKPSPPEFSHPDTLF